MCDITRSNFDLMQDRILKAIKDADFIAFDAEYTSLSLNNSLNKSLSDTAEKRYAKLRTNVTQSCMCQLGISAYVPHTKIENSYAVQTFNCYLFPQSFGPVDSRFVCQSSAVEFLSDHNFDFNKFFYEGISYLNRDQEELLRKSHKQGRLKNTFDSLKMKNFDVNELRTLRNSIRDWSLQAKLGEEKEFPAPSDDASRYILLADLSERFKDILCKYMADDEIHITKVNDQVAVQQCFDEEFERMFQALLGLSKIIRVISSLRKPVVGHNCLMDLVFMFKNFHRSLPESYKDFKKQLHDIFPVIYDTKHLSLLLRREMKNETEIFQETNLEDLHRMLNSRKGKFYVLYSPYVEHAPDFNRYDNSSHVHEAGYDAYLTGYVFIRMAHFLAAKDIRSTELGHLSFKDHIQAIKSFENHVNIARAALKYINFGGDDPLHRVPMKFIVTLRRNVGEIILAEELAQEFLRFGSTDVEMETSSKAIVTIPNSQKGKEVISAFKMHKKYRVTPSNDVSSIKADKLLIFGCALLLGFASGGFFYLLKS